MRRRGNKSFKVPNVKLRPADKGAYAQPIVESCWAQDTQTGSDDTAGQDSCPRPLKGVSICATGVTDKPSIFKKAVELGATCCTAFTDRVTHLIAVDHGGAKYTCALERKIPIVMPSWISENYDIWLRGDDVDAMANMEDHKLPIFSGVVVCPSGITDITRRTHISKMLKRHNGTYLKDLERPVRVTHLLCSGDEETEKMRYAEKFNSKGEARIHLVWEEWFWDSLDFGGRFDEAKYQVRRPRPARKSLVAIRNTSLPPSSTNPSQHDEAPSPSQHRNDEPEEEPAFLKVYPDVTLQLWGGLLERRGYQITDGEVILSPSKVSNGSDVAKKTVFPDPASPVRQKFGAARSVISNVRRTNSFAPVVPAAELGASRQLPFRRTATASAIFGGRSSQAGPSNIGNGSVRQEVSANDGVSGSQPTSGTPLQIFKGKRVRALGEAKGAVVRNAVEQLGGTSVGEDEEVDFIIVRLVTGSKLYRMEEDESLRRRYRTDCWLEQCIYEDRICAPDEHVSFVPLDIELPVIGAESVVISISGFEQSEAHALKRLFRALGITPSGTFSRHSTHLLCPSGTGLKFEKAREWEVPVVNVQWLATMASSGTIPHVHDYLVNGSYIPPRMRKIDTKGKGKAVDIEDTRPPAGDAGNAMEVEDDFYMNDDINAQLPIAGPHPNAPVEPPSTSFKSLQRESTIILPDPPEYERSVFGMPNHTLGGSSSYIAHPSSIATPTRSMISTPVLSGPSRQGSVLKNLNILDGEVGQETFDLAMSFVRRHRPTAEIDAARVPSSTSPSPMKAPLQRSTSRASLSPVKIDCEATKALQESITSLLGKRPSSESEEGSAGPNGAGAGSGAGPRNGKRARPQRSKAQSRQASDARLGGRAAAESPSSPRLPQQPDSGGPADYNNSGAVNAFDASYADDLNPQDESMRVMYEDPGQRDEKKRLLSLLKGQSSTGSGAGDEEQDQESQTLSTSSGSRDFERKTRRSMRIASCS